MGSDEVNAMYLVYDVCIVVTCQGRWIEFVIDINWNQYDVDRLKGLLPKFVWNMIRFELLSIC